MKNKSGIIHLLPLLLVGVLIVVVGGYILYFSQNSEKSFIAKEEEVVETAEDPNGDWKAFEDEELGIKFLYRPDIEITRKNNRVKFYYWPNSEQIEAQNWEVEFSAGISVVENSEGISLSDHVTKVMCTRDETTYSISSEQEREFETKRESACVNGFVNSIEKVEVVGIEGIKGNYNYFENPSILRLIEKDNNIYLFSLGGVETGGIPTELAKDTYQKILDSFEFID